MCLKKGRFSPMKKITSIKIEKLFGTFDYDINFEKNDGFTILTAPNGFGKSTILKIIRAAAAGNFCYFAGLVFDSIEINLRGTMADEWRPRMGPGSEPLPEDEGVKPKETRLVIRKETRNVVLEPEDGEEEHEIEVDEDTIAPYVCSISCDDLEISFTNEDLDNAMREVTAVNPSLEPLSVGLGNSYSSRLWKDKRDGEVLDLSGVFFHYEIHFRKIFPWIVQLVRRLNLGVNYISTNRLYEDDGERSFSPGRSRVHSIGDSRDSRGAHLLKILSISGDIRTAYNRSMREQLQKGRELETTFVERVVEMLNQKQRPSADDVRKRIGNRITAIRRLENSCNEFGMTSANRMNRDLQTDDDSALIVFNMYLDDVKMKLDVFEPLLKKLRLFAEALRDLLDLKTVSINLSQWDNILTIKNAQSGAVIPLDALSSGEQHLIVLLGRLLFDADNSNSLVMMDEPEISFHPSWQEKFADILFKIQNDSRETRNVRGSRRQFIIATHSPAFIGDRWDRTVELARMVREAKEES